jgi:lipoate-protein ligase A
MEWRLLIDGPRHGADNMAIDEALCESVNHNLSAPVLRFYRWTPPCLSLGFAQPFEAANASFCRDAGIDVVRRPTGGRAVLHHLELTYLVTARLDGQPFTTDLQASYRAICQALVAGFERLGVPATLAGSNPGDMIKPTQAIPCFVGPAAGEVVAHNRKLVGSAMRRIGDSILQHGAILLDWNGAMQAGALGLAGDRGMREAVITVADLLGSVPSPDVLHRAFADGFAASFGVQLVPSELTEAERARAAILARERYGHERWTVRRER